jgi:8-oxo-dGTP pyrophosphatase MutT (NUDIX family)|tara:strand:+ start:1198 stop:2046 length:849 start_codon:yes stop_codon:yes gene_type:complete
MKNPLQGANTQMADPNEAPTVPQAAATVLLVRDSKNEGIEVFLVERASKANFGGAFVFPGGKVDPEDGLDNMEAITTGSSDQELSNILGEDKGGLAYWVACIRECFEEAGILIAYREDGSPFDPSDSEERQRFVDYRNRLNAGEAVMEQMCQTEKLTLATERLAYLAHWITPKIEKRRYTTRFFIAISPSGQEGLHDGSESVNSLWIKPEEALEQQKEGKLLLIMPTIKNLESICGYANVEELLKDKSSIDPSTIPTIEPKFFMEDGKMVGLLPGDQGYEDH